MKSLRILAACVLGALPLATGQSQTYLFGTLAGHVGYGSADGRNSAARFHVPRGVAVDGNGNAYVADQYNCTIRKLTRDGTNWVVTTVAGLAGASGNADGTNSQARFNYPKNLTVDVAGSLYVADTGNATIRKITPNGTNWVVSTLAGLPGAQGTVDGTNTEARFMSPAAIAIDKAGDLFVADQGTIRKMALLGTNWVVTTVAGIAGTQGSLDGTNSQARFSIMEGIAVDDARNIFVTDWSGTIRKVTFIDTNWVVTTLAGQAGISGSADGTNSEARFERPIGLATDRQGNLYVADTGNALIRKVTLVGTNWVVNTLAGFPETSGGSDVSTTALFNSPISLAVGPAGDIYGTDGNNTIRKLTWSEKGWTVSTLAGLAAAAGSQDGSGSEAAFSFPSGVALDQAGNLYTADWHSHTIRQITPAGAVTTIAGLTGSPGTDDGTNSGARFSSPGGVAVDSAGTLYVADGPGTIRKLVTIGTNWVVSTIAGSPWAGGSTDGTNRVALFQSWLRGITTDRAGNVYVGDYFNNTIRKVTLEGTNWVVTTLAGVAGVAGNADGTNAAARFHFPDGLAVDRAGRLYVCDTENHTIRLITPLGTNWVVTTLAGTAGVAGSADGTNSNARFAWPHAITVDNLGALYVADSFNNTIRKLTPLGPNWVVTTIGGTPNGSPGYADGAGAAARFSSPQGIVIDDSGTLFVADLGNNAIRIGRLPPILQIAVMGNKVLLSWPGWAADFLPECASALGPGTPLWMPVPGKAQVLDSAISWTADTVDNRTFYRLRKP